jgi:hypothetical protein
MANPQDIAELHVLFETCGILDQATRALMIGHEGFINLALFGKLKSDSDITEMASKQMAHRTQQANGRVHLGIVVLVKDLQTLVVIWWICDRQKRNLALHGAADFDANTLADPDDFDTHEDAFLNLMSQTFGVLKEPLRYIVHPAMTLTAFGSNEEERMYQFPLEGIACFQMDNQTV